ncbi:MAG: calcium-binding protein [Mesorhizobium sp.]|uniref:excalibur calcium-binding domain-containing protein n=1 Tax=Mesorhizobium sp. TaxID=1871066 RepID=UPI000FE53D34|nr:excalibur calcium-binding domain-containing protein [Mesorhizobium sp.]RWB71520.1 MAG: calcium-binding protein [Mesorhizobium sp.]
MFRQRLLLFAATLSISGCAADYLNNYDSMTLASGDANNTNSLLQTVDPFNPNSNNTHIEGDGARSVAIVARYRNGSGSRGGDLDCAGGKGNNPVVQGPVAVSGSDPNRLDGDHDGIGCEK